MPDLLSLPRELKARIARYVRGSDLDHSDFSTTDLLSLGRTNKAWCAVVGPLVPEFFRMSFVLPYHFRNFDCKPRSYFSCTKSLALHLPDPNEVMRRAFDEEFDPNDIEEAVGAEIWSFLKDWRGASLIRRMSSLEKVIIDGRLQADTLPVRRGSFTILALASLPTITSLVVGRINHSDTIEVAAQLVSALPELKVLSVEIDLADEDYRERFCEALAVGGQASEFQSRLHLAAALSEATKLQDLEILGPALVDGSGFDLGFAATLSSLLLTPQPYAAAYIREMVTVSRRTLVTLGVDIPSLHPAHPDESGVCAFPALRELFLETSLDSPAMTSELVETVLGSPLTLLGLKGTDSVETALKLVKKGTFPFLEGITILDSRPTVDNGLVMPIESELTILCQAKGIKIAIRASPTVAEGPELEQEDSHEDGQQDGQW